MGVWQQIYWGYLSKPRHERQLCRHVLRGDVRRIVEFGVGTTERAQKLLKLALSFRPAAELEYTGIDLFEARSDGRGFTLKFAYQHLRPSGAKIRLVPGDPHAALSRVANDLAHTDLIVIAADQQGESLERAWSYFPRMLHPGTAVFVEERSPREGLRFRTLSHDEIAALAPPTVKLPSRKSRRAA